MDTELSREHQELRETARKLADSQLRPRADEVDRQGDYPWDHLHAMAQLGFCGLSIPTEYGGSAADALSLIVVTEEIARGCASAAAILMAFVVGAGTIVEAGSEEQKQRYLPSVARGERGICFAVTEPHAGSDVAAIRSVATRSGDDWVLNGNKALIGNVGPAEICVVALKTAPDAGHRGISVFVVEKGTPGLRVGHIEDKMGLRGTVTGELLLEDVRVPADALLGEPGGGFKYLMRSLNVARLTAAAQAIGIAQAAFEEALQYSQQRVTFGKPLAKHQAIRFALADMATEIQAARSLVYQACRLHDRGLPFVKEAAMAKLFASEMANRVAHKALQTHGGYGYIKGYAVERLYREARITEIYEGASEIQRMIIAGKIIGDG